MVESVVDLLEIMCAARVQHVHTIVKLFLSSFLVWGVDLYLTRSVNRTNTTEISLLAAIALNSLRIVSSFDSKPISLVNSSDGSRL